MKNVEKEKRVRLKAAGKGKVADLLLNLGAIMSNDPAERVCVRVLNGLSVQSCLF